MRYLLLFLSVLVAAEALTVEQKARALQFHQECFEVSGVDPLLVIKARHGDFTNDAKFKEHLFCFSKKAGFQNEDGQIQPDVLKTKLATAINDETKAEKLVVKCAVQKETPQETAFDTIKCYYAATHGGS